MLKSTLDQANQLVWLHYYPLVPCNHYGSIASLSLSLLIQLVRKNAMLRLWREHPKHVPCLTTHRRCCFARPAQVYTLAQHMMRLALLLRITFHQFFTSESVLNSTSSSSFT